MLYHSAITGWWRWDDTQILKHVIEYSIWKDFLVPSVWQRLSSANFTPWVCLSFDLDLQFFGLNPTAFYVHHIFVLWLVGLATFFFLRLWLTRLWAILGSFLFLCGAPVATVSQQLMTRHYVEGLLFSVLALYFYIYSVRENSQYLSWAGALSYLIAMSAKEVFVPLIAILPFLPEGDLRSRWKAFYPFILMVVAYALWRHYMIGSALGSYGHLFNLTSAAALPYRAGTFLFGDGILGITGILVFCLVLVIALWRKHNHLVVAVVTCAAIICPIIPVALGVNDPGRYLLVIWWVVAVTTVLAFGQVVGIGRKTFILKTLLYALILGSVLSQSLQTADSLTTTNKRFDTVGRFILGRDTQESLLMYLPVLLSQSPCYVSGLLWIKEKVTGQTQDASILADPKELEGLHRSGQEVWTYEDRSQTIKDISRKIPDILSAWGAKVCIRPLSAELCYSDNNDILWHFGLYKEGQYTFLGRDEFGVTSRLRLPARGKTRALLTASTIPFYLRYDSPEGWITYSPLLYFKPRPGVPFSWNR
jgi:hypothetical protein